MSECAPTRIVGLRYEPEDGAPQVILKASGEAAEELLRARQRMARAPQVVRNPALLEQLYRLPVDGRIGPELYRVAAILLAHVLAVDAGLQGGSDG
jgi:type III secretion system FlhB-like substrate exporter